MAKIEYRAEITEDGVFKPHYAIDGVDLSENVPRGTFSGFHLFNDKMEEVYDMISKPVYLTVDSIEAIKQFNQFSLAGGGGYIHPENIPYDEYLSKGFFVWDDEAQTWVYSDAAAFERLLSKIGKYLDLDEE